MIAGAHQTTEDRIITILSEEGMLKAEELQRRLKKEELSVTIQGIYRILRKLQREGVIIKEKQRFSLRIPWLLGLLEMAEKMEHVYLQEQYITQLLPNKPHEKKTWYFTNLIKMANFWSQLFILMAKVSEQKISLDYSPHLWYELVQKEQEHQFLTTFLSEVEKSYAVVGGRTPLDKYTDKHAFPFENEYVYMAAPDEYILKDRRKYLSVIDDLLLTITIDQKLTDRIETFYAETTDVAPFDVTPLHQICKKSGRIKMSIEKNADKALVYYKKFEKLFGPIR